MGNISENIKKIILFMFLLLIAVGAFSYYYFSPKVPFRYAGTITATKVVISSRVTSIISEINAKQGEHVKIGQAILKMSCEDLKINATLAARNFARQEKLYVHGSQSQEAYESFKNVNDEALLKLSWCTVLSPISGSVLTKYHEVGEMVTPATKLFTLANLQEVYAYIYVPGPLVSQLKLGQVLSGIIPELNEREFAGKITEIGEQAEFTPKNVQTREERSRLVFAVKISFSNPEEILKPGMTIEVQLPHDV